MSKNNNGWAPHLISRVEEIDIDPEIEKEIAQLQEANFAEKIKEIKLVEKKQEQKVELADELGSFFGAITKAKVDLTSSFSIFLVKSTFAFVMAPKKLPSSSASSTFCSCFFSTSFISLIFSAKFASCN